MFLVLNASGLCFIPIGIMMYRAQAGASILLMCFCPLQLATFISTMVGIIAMCLSRGIRLWDRVLLSWLGGWRQPCRQLYGFFSTLPKEEVELYSGFFY